MATSPRRLALLLAPAALSACAAGGGFPSLSPRAAEREASGGSAPAPCVEVADTRPVQTVEAAAPPPSDPALRARVAELRAAAEAGQADYLAALPAAERAVASAGAAGSEEWVEAQQQISRLSAARARTADALAELDALGIRRSAERAVNEADHQAVIEAAAEARALADRQQAELDRLSSSLGAS